MTDNVTNCLTCADEGVVGNGNAMFPEPCPHCSLSADLYAAQKERDELRALCEMVDAHYSGSLDSQPGYVKRIREALHGY